MQHNTFLIKLFIEFLNFSRCYTKKFPSFDILIGYLKFLETQHLIDKGKTIKIIVTGSTKIVESRKKSLKINFKKILHWYFYFVLKLNLGDKKSFCEKLFLRSKMGISSDFTTKLLEKEYKSDGVMALMESVLILRYLVTILNQYIF